MCRYHQLWGCCLIAFGAGILLGAWLEGEFLRNCLGICLTAAGIMLIRRQCGS